jgi:hypothetical protein
MPGRFRGLVLLRTRGDARAPEVFRIDDGGAARLRHIEASRYSAPLSCSWLGGLFSCRDTRPGIVSWARGFWDDLSAARGIRARGSRRRGLYEDRLDRTQRANGRERHRRFRSFLFIGCRRRSHYLPRCRPDAPRASFKQYCGRTLDDDPRGGDRACGGREAWPFGFRASRP